MGYFLNNILQQNRRSSEIFRDFLRLMWLRKWHLFHHCSPSLSCISRESSSRVFLDSDMSKKLLDGMEDQKAHSRAFHEYANLRQETSLFLLPGLAELRSNFRNAVLFFTLTLRRGVTRKLRVSISFLYYSFNDKILQLHWLILTKSGIITIVKIE